MKYIGKLWQLLYNYILIYILHEKWKTEKGREERNRKKIKK